MGANHVPPNHRHSVRLHRIHCRYADDDYKGYKDPALFTRMPHYFLSTEDSLVDKPFEAFEFTVKNGAQSVEGHHLHTPTFSMNPPVPARGFCRSSGIMRRRPGRSGARSCPTTSGGRPFASQETARRRGFALEAFNEGRQYELNIIERQLMKQEVVADAAALRSGLTENGHVEVPGILFDFGKSEIKPESEPALAQVAAFAAGQPASRRGW